MVPIGRPSALAALLTTMSTPPSSVDAWCRRARRARRCRPQCVGTASAVPPGVADRGRRRLARVGLPARDHDRGAARGVGLGDGAADAPAAAGDDRDAAVEVELAPDLAAGAHRCSLAAGRVRRRDDGALARAGAADGARGPGLRRPAPDRPGRPAPRAPGVRPRRADPDRLGERARPFAGAAALRAARSAPARPAARRCSTPASCSSTGRTRRRCCRSRRCRGSAGRWTSKFTAGPGCAAWPRSTGRTSSAVLRGGRRARADRAERHRRTRAGRSGPWWGWDNTQRAFAVLFAYGRDLGPAPAATSSGVRPAPPHAPDRARRARRALRARSPVG